MINFSSGPILAVCSECCICRQNKTKKGGSGYEKLVKYVTVNAAKYLQNAALVKREIYPHLQIELVVMEVSMIIAREHHYHKGYRCILLKKPAEKKGKKRNSFIKNVKIIFS